MILRKIEVVFCCLEWEWCTFQKIDSWKFIQIHQYYTMALNQIIQSKSIKIIFSFLLKNNVLNDGRLHHKDKIVSFYLTLTIRTPTLVFNYISPLIVKAPSHYNELAQRTPAYGKIWHSLVYAAVRSDIVLKSLFFVFGKFVFVVIRSVWRDFLTRDNDKSREIRERSPNVLIRWPHSLSYATIRLNVVLKSLLSAF